MEVGPAIRWRGRPATIGSDNGTELTSMAVLRWCQLNGVEWHYIAPGSQHRTPSSRASTGASETNASTTHCSRRSLRPAAPSPHGRRTTTITDHIRHSAICPPAEFAMKSTLEKQAAQDQKRNQDSASSRRRLVSQVNRAPGRRLAGHRQLGAQARRAVAAEDIEPAELVRRRGRDTPAR